MEERDYPFGEFAVAQLQVAPEPDECESDCDDASCEDAKGAAATADVDAEIAEWRDEQLREACDHLVGELPPSFREDVRSDAEALAKMQLRLCPDVPWLTLRLEVAQFNACGKWHQDAHVGRAIITYVGPGTCTADDASVRWDQFDRTLEETMHEPTNESCVPDGSCKQMETNSVLLMKGDSWPGICGSGLTHKAPAVPLDEAPKRLLLKVDLTRHRTAGASESEEEGGSEEEGESEEEVEEESEEEEEEEQTMYGRMRKRRRRSSAE